MALSPNQFAQTTVQGQLDLHTSNQGNVISCRVSSTEATALVPGQAVKLEDVAGGVPKVTALTADTDVSFAFVVRNLKDIDREASESLEVAFNNSIMYMTAGAAIARGASVEVVSASNKVITSAGTNPITGYAFDKAAADGDLIRVYITTPQSFSVPIFEDITVNGLTISDVNDYSAGAGALPIDKNVIALTTGAGAEALTLADGVDGQELEIIHVVDGGGTGTVTPTNYANGSTIAFAAVGESARFRFVNAAWHNVGTPTATVA